MLNIKDIRQEDDSNKNKNVRKDKKRETERSKRCKHRLGIEE